MGTPRRRRLQPLVVTIVISASLLAGAVAVRSSFSSAPSSSLPATPGRMHTPTAPASGPAAVSSPSAPVPHVKKPKHEEHEPYDPTGHLSVAQGHDVEAGHDSTVSFVVEVEDGINVDLDEFAAAVEGVLFDHRSWPVRFERVDHGDADFHVVLASPELTDQMCLPLDTAGIYSCFQSGNAVLNSMRWKRGADAYGDDLDGYRIYMVNHEVGHALGRGHEECGGAGQRAPVMMQQTKGVSPCRPDPWP